MKIDEFIRMFNECSSFDVELLDCESVRIETDVSIVNEKIRVADMSMELNLGDSFGSIRVRFLAKDVSVNFHNADKFFINTETKKLEQQKKQIEQG